MRWFLCVYANEGYLLALALWLIIGVLLEVGVSSCCAWSLIDFVELSTDVDDIVEHLLSLVGVEALPSILRDEYDLLPLDELRTDLGDVELCEFVDCGDVVDGKDLRVDWRQFGHAS